MNIKHIIQKAATKANLEIVLELNNNKGHATVLRSPIDNKYMVTALTTSTPDLHISEDFPTQEEAATYAIEYILKHTNPTPTPTQTKWVFRLFHKSVTKGYIDFKPTPQSLKERQGIQEDPEEFETVYELAFIDDSTQIYKRVPIFQEDFDLEKYCKGNNIFIHK